MWIATSRSQSENISLAIRKLFIYLNPGKAMRGTLLPNFLQLIFHPLTR